MRGVYANGLPCKRNTFIRGMRSCTSPGGRSCRFYSVQSFTFAFRLDSRRNNNFFFQMLFQVPSTRCSRVASTHAHACANHVYVVLYTHLRPYYSM